MGDTDLRLGVSAIADFSRPHLLALIQDRVVKARALATELGPLGIATHVARRLLCAVPGGETFRFFLIVLSEPHPTPAAAAAGRDHTFRFASRPDLEALRRDPASGIFDRDLESFANGNRCLLQLDGDQLVGYSWVGGSPLVELMWGIHFNMPDDMVYNYNGYTVPRYRGTAFQALRHLKVLEHTRAEGKQRLFGYVDHLNYKSLRGVEKSGYTRVGVLRGVKRAGKTSFSVSIDSDAWSEIVRSGPKQR